MPESVLNQFWVTFHRLPCGFTNLLAIDTLLHLWMFFASISTQKKRKLNNPLCHSRFVGHGIINFIVYVVCNTEKDLEGAQTIQWLRPLFVQI